MCLQCARCGKREVALYRDLRSTGGRFVPGKVTTNGPVVCRECFTPEDREEVMHRQRVFMWTGESLTLGVWRTQGGM